jgi:hypothetical protein
MTINSIATTFVTGFVWSLGFSLALFLVEIVSHHRLCG